MGAIFPIQRYSWVNCPSVEFVPEAEYEYYWVVMTGLRISVAMATYNGSRYIQQQLKTILHQLGAEDEVVIVDDGSTDGTCKVIESFCDPRIRLLRNEVNCGVIRTFEKALSNTRGEIIFLSDQDDLWKPDKVSRVLQAFQDPETTLVLSDANIIDEEGTVTAASFFKTRGGFIPGIMRNILRNSYIGCTMAFRSQILEYCLPFPKDVPMHDAWIGLVSDSFGKTDYVDRPLVEYRRHGSNYSNRGSRMQQARWRWSLIHNLCRLRIKYAASSISFSS